MFTVKNIKSDEKIKLTVDYAIKQLIDNNDRLSELPLQLQQSILFLSQTCVKKDASKIKLDNPFKLASLFMANKDVRYYLNFIYSNGEQLIASNGHTLIRIQHKSEAGFYNKLGVLCESPEFAKFPDFSKVMNAKKFNNISINSGIESLTSWNEKEHYVIDYADIRYDSKYINILRKIGITEFQLCDSSNAAYFKKDNFDGVIMPIRK